MNGDSLNNNGQVLLLLVLVLGTLLIVAMTAIFQSTTSTQLGGIEQQSQVTLAAAEAAIEKALQSGQSGSFQDLGLTNLSGISLENSTVEITEERPYVYIAPKMEKDTQYTFYLAEYTGTFPDYFSDSYDAPFYIFYESGNPECSDVALELTVIYDEGGGDGKGDNEYEMEKYIVDAGDQITSDNSKDLFDSTFTGPQTFSETVFNCRTTLFDTDTLPNIKLVFVQTYLRGTTFAFAVDGYQGLPDSLPVYQFPPQGRTVTATARAKVSAEVTAAEGQPTPTPLTGLTRTAQIFQSYPQIPAEFWITSF